MASIVRWQTDDGPESGIHQVRGILANLRRENYDRRSGKYNTCATHWTSGSSYRRVVSNEVQTDVLL